MHEAVKNPKEFTKCYFEDLYFDINDTQTQGAYMALDPVKIVVSAENTWQSLIASAPCAMPKSSTTSNWAAITPVFAG